MLFLFCRGIIPKIIAVLIFILACLSDYYDGKIAKKRNLISDFGILMDPIADKILVLGAFLSFVQMQLVPAWMVILIFTREFLITGLRLFAITKGKILAAQREGKHKTVSQMFAISLILAYLLLKEILIKFDIWTNQWEFYFRRGIYILMLITVILTLTSGISYFWKNRKLIRL
jgi:CDP-diacylglycerol--glycerol-3-phosphate 3-phosphatidyltransferase